MSKKYFIFEAYHSVNTISPNITPPKEKPESYYSDTTNYNDYHSVLIRDSSNATIDTISYSWHDMNNILSVEIFIIESQNYPTIKECEEIVEKSSMFCQQEAYKIKILPPKEISKEQLEQFYMS